MSFKFYLAKFNQTLENFWTYGNESFGGITNKGGGKSETESSETLSTV